MATKIPTYPLQILAADKNVEKQELLLLDYQVDPGRPLEVPHRTGYYGIGICLRGEAAITANLEAYRIFPGCLIAMSPHIVKQWLSKSEDFETVAVLFTESFFSPTSDSSKNEFEFFQNISRNIFPLSQEQADEIIASIQFIHHKQALEYRSGNQLTRQLIQALLLEVASLYQDFDLSVSSMQTRAHTIAADFKRLLKLHFLQERSVSFYADKLFITPRHLTETVREVTGRTPGEWIVEAVVLEAKVLLLDSGKTITQISDQLNFADSSAFGRYFKKSSGISPALYRSSH